MDTTEAVVITSEWQSLNTLAGIPIGDRMIVDNFGPTVMLVAVSATKPTSSKYGITVEPYEPMSIRAGENEVWARTVPLGTETYASCQDGVTISPVSSLATAIAKFNTLKPDYVRTLAVDTAEIYAAEGLRYNFVYDKVFSASEEVLILYRLPADATVIAGLDQRFFKSLSGACELEVIWDATINEADVGAELTVFNEYNKSTNVNQLKFYLLSAYTGGITRDVDFVPSVGQGANTVGGAAAGEGYRLYGVDTDVVLRLKNNSTNPNRIRFSYGYIEFPIQILEV